MGLLNNSWCYLVGNLENTEDAFKWREELSYRLWQKFNINCFDPNKEHFVNQQTENEETRLKLKEARAKGDLDTVHFYLRQIIRRDLRYIDLSSFIIYNVEPDQATFGSIHEVVVASQQRKPILCRIDDKKKFPMWMAGLLNVKLIWETWDELLDYLGKIDNKEEYADPKYWKILIN